MAVASILFTFVPGIGEHGAQPGSDASLGQLVAAGVQERVQQGAVHRVLRQHRAHDHLARGGHGLAVVPGHVALLVAHHPHVRVGDIRPRLGASPVGAHIIAGPAPARFPGRRGRVPGLLVAAEPENADSHGECSAYLLARTCNRRSAWLWCNVDRDAGRPDLGVLCADEPVA
jgi:hypothetical protein